MFSSAMIPLDICSYVSSSGLFLLIYGALILELMFLFLYKPANNFFSTILTCPRIEMPSLSISSVTSS